MALDDLLIGSEPLLSPVISPAVAAAVRGGLGVLMLLTLLRALPMARLYFLSERWGGYGERGWRVDVVQNPVVMPIVYLLWLAANVALVWNRATVLAAAFNLACCYYFFISMRWRGVLRGMGAPGFIAYWLSAAVFLIELTRHHAPSLHGLALFVLQVDFALIFLAAGIYKFTAGYRHGEGMELGMVNPEWGYWGRLWGSFAPRHPLFRFFNEMAWGTEVVAAVLMLFPQTRFLGGMLILLSFIFIASQIRLGFLCEMVIVCCFVFFHPGSLGDRVFAAVLPPVAPPVVTEAAPWVIRGLQILLWAYVLLLPLARVGLSYNLHRKRALPGVLQGALDLYANLFGLILWRVFSADHTNFLIDIYEQPAVGERRLISRWTDIWRYHHRYNQVAEGITVTTLFTTLKYYPSNRQIFVDRLLRYARTVPRDPGSRLVFQHVSVLKRADRFELVPAADFIVDLEAGTVEEVTLDAARSVRAAIDASPLHEAARPGTYAPLKG